MPRVTSYKDACREIKYEHVKQNLKEMPKLIAEWRARKKILKTSFPF